MMRTLCGAFCMAGVLLSGSATASPGSQEVHSAVAENRAGYPCDVFSYAFCFRKSEGDTLRLSDGPDFSLYAIQDARGEQRFTIYLGRAPEQLPKDATALATVESERGELTLYRMPKRGDNADLFNVVAKHRNGTWVHVYGVRDQASTVALLETLSSFRLCTNVGESSLQCDEKPVLAFEVAKKLLLPSPLLDE